MFSAVVATLSLAAFTVISGCDQPAVAPPEPTSGNVRFIHTAASAGILDFTVLNGGGYVDVFFGTTYGQQFSTLFGTGSRNFRLYLPAPSTTSIAETVLNIEENKRYTLLATDQDAAVSPTLFITTDTLAKPLTGKVFVRFIHASADAPAMNILKTDGSPVISNLNRLEAREYVTLDAGTYTFKATDTASATLLTFNPYTFLSGYIYTVVLSGTTGSFSYSALNAAVYIERGLE